VIDDFHEVVAVVRAFVAAGDRIPECGDELAPGEFSVFHMKPAIYK
jgi:hypothetical protein